MTTRLLIVGTDLWTVKTWAERNARFTIGFDHVIPATAAEVQTNALARMDPFDGVVLVRDAGPGRRFDAALLRALRHVASESVIVVAPAARITAPPAADTVEGAAVTVAQDGWGGVMRTGPDLTIPVDGITVPMLRWDIPLYRADALLTALEVLDEIGDLLAAHGGEGPNGWQDERKALGELLDGLVEAGRARRDHRGDIEPVLPAVGAEA